MVIFEMMKKRIFLSLVIVFILIIVLAILIIKLQKPSKAMHKLPLGSTYDELIAIAGTPDYVTDGTVGVEIKFEKSETQLIPDCVKEAWYQYPISFVPSKYSFCFDKNDTLIHKYHWSSW
ncbi:hypothetical protein [Microbulbifer discodermiae]|uniref:hypothetical protein n=1 Tax=Microbulbifer sp. 2201CG32-9 TaxID=3232309 RepID=UPI00345BA616